MDEKLINRAFLFASRHFNESCHNFGKPVFFHCVKVAMKLCELGYEDKLIVGGILHDLVEDTDCKLSDMEHEFGKEMANLVDAVSFNPNIEDKFEQSKQMIDASLTYGRDALVIKSVDMCENGKYFALVTNPDVKDYLIKKYAYFTEVAGNVISGEPAFDCYLEVAKTIK